MSNFFTVQNTWGGKPELHGGGLWVIGGRDSQRVVALDVTSSDGGNTLKGTMTYQSEGPIGFVGTLIAPNTYRVTNSWGHSGGHPGGTWVLGGRSGQKVTEIKIASKDGGQTMEGTMTYEGEGPIGFKGENTSNVYSVENSWGGSGGHNGGQWVLGGREGQNVVAIEISSKDGGKNLEGTMTYKGEGPIGFKGSAIGGNQYVVENSWGGSGGHPGGIWIIGARSSQAIVSLAVNSTDGGATLSGNTTYQGEGPIGFIGTRAD